MNHPWGSVMQELRRIEQDILTRGRVDSDHLETLRLAVYAGGVVGRPAADALVELHKRVQHPNPAFEQFFFQAIKAHVLADGRIDSEEVAWLRQVLIVDGTLHDEGRKLLHELNGEAGAHGPAFASLFAEAMMMPQERRTSS